MPSPQVDKHENQAPTSELLASPAEIAARLHSKESWFVLSRELDETVLAEWAELHSCHAELPFYLHPDWLRSFNHSLFEDSIRVISVFRITTDADSNDALQEASNASAAAGFNAAGFDAAGYDAANRSNWLPSVMFAVTSNNGTSLLSPAHDHLTLGDLLIHPSLSATDTRAAIAAVLESDLARRLEFGNLPNSSTLMRSVSAADSSSRDTNLWVCSSVRETAWFDLDSESSVPSGKLRRNLNRLERKLKETGAVEYRFTTGDELNDAYRRFLQIEASGWKGSTGTETSILGNVQLEQFYGSLLKPEYEKLRPSINELFVNDQLLASQFSLCTGCDWYILKIAYDESYADYSPGSLLLHAMVLHAKEAGIRRLSLVTNPPWAERWHPQTETVWRLVRHGSPFLALGAKAFNEIKSQVRQRVG